MLRCLAAHYVNAMSSVTFLEALHLIKQPPAFFPPPPFPSCPLSHDFAYLLRLSTWSRGILFLRLWENETRFFAGPRLLHPTVPVLSGAVGLFFGRTEVFSVCFERLYSRGGHKMLYTHI